MDDITNLILLTPEQHKMVLLNVSVTLVWFNVGGSFSGPYVTKEAHSKFIPS